MKRVVVGALGAMVAVSLASGCTQIAQLKPVAGDAVTSVRIATNDVLVNNGVAISVAPVCTFSGNLYDCKGIAADGSPILGHAEVMPVAQVPANLQPLLPTGEAATDTASVLEVKVGDNVLYSGLTDTVLNRNGRTG